MRKESLRLATLLPLSLLLAISLGACRQAPAPADVDAPKPGPIEQVVVEPEADVAETRPELPPLFRDIERRTFQFFWDTTNEANGLTPDRYPSRPFSSVAAVGFALTAYPIGIENGWVSRTQAVDRTLATLKFLREAPQGPQANGRAGHKGFFYHFVDIDSGHRYNTWVELSSVDTGLLMMGVLFAQSYYDGDDTRDRKSVV